MKKESPSLELVLEEFIKGVGIEFNKLYNSQMKTESELRAFKEEMRLSREESEKDRKALHEEMKAFKDKMREENKKMNKGKITSWHGKRLINEE